MVSNSTIINKPKNHLSPSLITEQKKNIWPSETQVRVQKPKQRHRRVTLNLKLMLSPLSRGIKIEGMLMLSCICDIVIILMFHIRKVTLYVYSFICGCLLLKRSIYGRKSCLLLCFKICSFSLTFSHNFTC